MVHERTGLDVGEFPADDQVAGVADDDPTRLVRTVAHMVARVFDKVPPLRRLSRQAEGTGKRSGLVSDALAAAREVYVRNSDEVNARAKDFAVTLRDKQRERVAEAKRQAASRGNNGGMSQTPTGGHSHASR